MIDIDPKTQLAIAVSVERDLSIMTGPELVTKYTASEDSKLVFRHVTGKSAPEASVDHNPFWHYLLQTWYRAPTYRKLLYPKRHRDEVADAIVKMCLGELDSYDGVIHQYPRRALKSFFMKMAACWLPKRHKIMENMDILIYYSHNLEKRAKAAMTSVKHMNRYNRYISKHFGSECKTITGQPANFVIPRGEWGTKEEWDWPCRASDFMPDHIEKSRCWI
jgi:hypothetical protein